MDCLLIDHEDIVTYGHLSNLTQQEWDRIKKLPMNALKTIKFYVDQEKHLTAAHKLTNKNNEKDVKLTYCELLAKLHMIKLFFIQQLENENGIERIPQLEGECVDKAFEEMQQEGYEDDGLFDDMKLFFQPLTITDDELKINPDELSNANQDQQKQLNQLENLIKILNENYDQTEENQLKTIETERMEKENLRSTIEALLANQQTKIDRNLIQLHRGFIMYGPPGTGKSHLMSKLAKKIGIAMLAPPLASSNLERSLVGQSEAVISSLCRRAKCLPHLICCLSIDEIDSLAPKRDEKSSEGKVSKISVLLSVLEGAENVSNLMFFSATNL